MLLGKSGTLLNCAPISGIHTGHGHRVGYLVFEILFSFNWRLFRVQWKYLECSTICGAMILNIVSGSVRPDEIQGVILRK